MTIKDFARAIGVSPATVSRALQGNGRISPATRKRVLQRAQELGYTPNINAQRLRAERTNLIALNCGERPNPLADMFFVESLQGIQAALQPQGYGLLLNAPGDSPLRWVKALAVDGVVLGGDPGDESLAVKIAGMGVPCVVMGTRSIEGIPGVGSTITGLQRGARQVAKMLVECGHRRIGFITGFLPSQVLTIFREELATLGVAPHDVRIILTGLTPEDGACAARALLAQPDPPTAIFARTDALAFGVLAAARQLGIRVPDQLSIVGHDDVPFAKLTDPPLTTVRVDCAAEGKAAVDILFSLINQPDAPGRIEVVDTELVMRETVAAAPIRR
jgi:DNA-binding LacI/PurR family transcriptional regulator